MSCKMSLYIIHWIIFIYLRVYWLKGQMVEHKIDRQFWGMQFIVLMCDPSFPAFNDRVFKRSQWGFDGAPESIFVEAPRRKLGAPFNGTSQLQLAAGL